MEIDPARRKKREANRVSAQRSRELRKLEEERKAKLIKHLERTAFIREKEIAQMREKIHELMTVNENLWGKYGRMLTQCCCPGNVMTAMVATMNITTAEAQPPPLPLRHEDGSAESGKLLPAEHSAQ